jgi:hypothetical protein
MSDFNGLKPHKEILNSRAKSRSKVSWDEIEENHPESLPKRAIYGL